MTAVTQRLWWAALVMSALALTACPGPTPTPDSGVDAGGGDDCVDASDCPDQTYFDCDPDTSKCVPTCRSVEQCNNRPAEYTLDYCQGTLGCQCDEGSCVSSLCSADEDCGATSVCRNGQCVAAPEASTVAKCSITPDLAVFAPGSKATFFVSAWDENNNPVVVKEGATWSALGAAVTLSGGATGTSTEFTAATTPSAAADAIQASFGNASCKAKAVVLSAPAAGEVAVSVIDELSGRPVEGANVVVSSSSGAIIQQAGNAESLTTDGSGEARLTFGTETTYTVTVFHADFGYLTVANYSGGSRFLSFAVRRNSIDKYGGYKGTFTNVPVSGNVHAGLAGMSLAGSITNLNITQLLGPSVKTNVQIGTVVNQPDVPIPAGVFLGFSDSTIKGNIAGQGLNGVCSDEAKVLSGSCGTRAAWALAGDVSINELPIDQVVNGLDNIDIGALLSRIVPIFRKFNSSIVRDVEFEMRATPIDAGTPNFSDQSFFTTADHDFQQIPLAFSFVAKLPELPKFKGSYVDGAAIIGGANAVGRGVVPLGIGVGVNTATPIDGQIDPFTSTNGTTPSLPAGSIGVRMAPAHHGIEGSHYGLVVAAISAKALTDASAGIGASALFPRLPGNKIAFDPEGNTPLDLHTQAFPAFPEGAKFNYTDTADGALPGRSFALTAVANTGIIRVSFSDSLERRWDVLVDAASPSFTLPKMPAGVTLSDRLFANAGGARSGLTVQGFRMKADPYATTGADLSFNEYVELNGTNQDRTTDFLTAFSFLSYTKPSISITAPTAGGTLTGDKTVSVEVKGFSIGTGATNDGVVLVSTTGGTGCALGATGVLSTEDEMAGSGKVHVNLPAACTGEITIQAALVKVDGVTQILPPVQTSVTATVQ